MQPLLFCFSSFPSPHALSFFLPSMPSLLWFWGFSGLRNLLQWPPFTQITANFVRLVFKKLVRCFQRILLIFENGSWSFRPFGINASHFAEYSSPIFDNVTTKWAGFCVQQFFSAGNPTFDACVKVHPWVTRCYSQVSLCRNSVDSTLCQGNYNRSAVKTVLFSWSLGNSKWR